MPSIRGYVERQIKKIHSSGQSKDFNEGENIVSAEDSSREMFVLLTGEADVCSSAKIGEKRC